MTADDYTQAEIVRTLKRIEDKVDAMAVGYVPRPEFELVKAGQGREIADLKTTVARIETLRDSARAPWWSVVTAVAAAVAVAVSLIPLIAK